MVPSMTGEVQEGCRGALLVARLLVARPFVLPKAHSRPTFSTENILPYAWHDYRQKKPLAEAPAGFLLHHDFVLRRVIAQSLSSHSTD